MLPLDPGARSRSRAMRNLHPGVARPGQDSIPIIVDLQQRECAQGVRYAGRRGRVQIGTVEFGKLRDSEETEAAFYLVLKKFKQPQHAGFSAGSKREALHAAD